MIIASCSILIPPQNKKTAEAISIDFLFSHAIIDIEKGRAGNTPHVEPLKRRWLK
nr:MAG TPA: hypothetical protein [Caudoviricetes sp.]